MPNSFVASGRSMMASRSPPFVRSSCALKSRPARIDKPSASKYSIRWPCRRRPTSPGAPVWSCRALALYGGALVDVAERNERRDAGGGDVRPRPQTIEDLRVRRADAIRRQIAQACVARAR